MMQFNPQSNFPPKVLATDLDGTLIPLDGDAGNMSALETISTKHQAGGFKLVFATGRHLESVMEAIDVFKLPIPDWLICDVGTSVYERAKENGGFRKHPPYREHLEALTNGVSRTQVETLLSGIAGIGLQSAERQQEFKISYECPASLVDTLVRTINETLAIREFPYACTGSVDPFEKCGLLDVLPTGLSKAYALVWLAEHAGFQPGEVVFAGDSGNDKAALVSGFRAILVGNASKGLAKDIKDTLRAKGLEGRLYHAGDTATSGVLQGCRHFGLF